MAWLAGRNFFNSIWKLGFMIASSTTVKKYLLCCCLAIFHSYRITLSKFRQTLQTDLIPNGEKSVLFKISPLWGSSESPRMISI